MESFGEELRKGIENSGYTIYQFAKISGINRTNIQRYMEDQRFPSLDVFKIMLEHLKISSEHKKTLEDIYSILNIGKPLYDQRLFIKQLLESFSAIYEIEKQSSLFAGSSVYKENTLPTQERFQIIKGSLSVIRLLQSEAIRVTNTQENPCVNLFLPINDGNDLLKSGLTALGLNFRKPLEVNQLFTMIPSSASCSGNHNLKILSYVLPFCFSFSFHYNAYYYYDTAQYNPGFWFMFPNYAIFNDSLLLFSATLEDAVLCTEPQMVSYYKNSYQEKLRKCQSFIQSAASYDNIILSFFQNYDRKDRERLLNYHPCLLSVGTPELADKLLRDDIEDREAFLDKVLQRLEIFNNANRPLHFFSEEGLIDFIATGISHEFPPAYVKQISPEDRVVLLKRLKNACESGQQDLRIINPFTFHVPNYLVMNITANYAYFFNYMKSNLWTLVSISEPSIYQALIDFMDSLADSPYVYSREDTLLIMENHIAAMEQKLTS